MKKTIKKIRRQRGFALIEVMLATLVMTIGGIAYMKLQQRGLKYNYNNYARTQGLAISQGLVEQLRANVGYFGNTRISGQIAGNINPSAAVSCSSSTPTSGGSSSMVNHACARQIFAYQQGLISRQMATVSGNSILCYQEKAGGARGYIRVTYIWQDNSQAGRNVQLNCPTSFSAAIPTTNKANTVSIYAQL